MYCKECGKEVNQEWSTCPFCGCSLAGNVEQNIQEKPKKKGKVGKILVFVLLVLIGLMALGGAEEEKENTGGNEPNAEIDLDAEGTDKTNEQNIELSYDFETDAQRGVLYANKDGRITDASGNVIPDYEWLQVTEDGMISDGESIFEGYIAEESGKIVWLDLGDVDYSDIKTPLENLKEKASWEMCTTEIITDEYWLNTDFPDLATDVADDGSYFDEVVLGAWFDENGAPIAGGLPDKLSFEIANYNLSNDSKASGLLEHFHFINGESFSIDTLKRTSPNELATYAIVVTNIKKDTGVSGNMYFQGWDYISSTPIIIHGDFSKILNGDDLLVFAEYTGLASDDTPNFKGIYIEIINDRGIN